MSKKPDKAALARVDSRALVREAEWAMEDFEYYSNWRNQIAYYRDQAEKLPDARSVPIWTPITKIGKKGREYLEAEGAAQKEIDGTLHFATGSKATPRARLEAQINDAEQAAEAGHIGRYGLHIAAIVTSLHNAQLPSIEKSTISRDQSKRSRGKQRRKRWGTLRTVLEGMTYTNADDAMEQWKAGRTVGGYRLHHEAGEDKPFKANGEGFTKERIRSKVSAIKGKKPET